MSITSISRNNALNSTLLKYHLTNSERLSILKLLLFIIPNMNYKLYNGTVDLEFIESKHLYKVDNLKIDGVTSVLKVLDKPALIYWAVGQTIEFFKQTLKPGQSYGEMEIQAMLNEGKVAFRKKSKFATDFGSLVHEWIEKYIKGQKPEPFTDPKLKNSVDKFLKWEADNKVKFIESERMIYSKKYKYAGTLDFIAEIDGKKWLGDIKTSKAIYDEYLFQTAAYRQAYTEETHEKVAGELIVRIGKDGDEVEIAKSTDEHTTPYWVNRNAFNHCLKLYRTLETLKKFKFQYFNGQKIERSSI